MKNLSYLQLSLIVGIIIASLVLSFLLYNFYFKSHDGVIDSIILPPMNTIATATGNPSTTTDLTTGSTSTPATTPDTVAEFIPSEQLALGSHGTAPTQPINANLQWGVYAGPETADLQDFESLVGKPVDIAAVFVDWESDFPAEFATPLLVSGKTLLIFWEQEDFPLSEIVDGGSDEYLASFATAVTDYGGSVILAPLPEMNGDWDTWGGTVGDNTPELVVETWQHIVDGFKDVPNVKFAWTVNNVSEPDIPENSIDSYYPGDEYVDYVAVDGFNFGDPWQTFSEVFDPALAQLQTYQKPIYILSTASAEGKRKAEWIIDAFTVQLPKYPGVAGLVWFNEQKENDWRVNSDPNALNTFKLVTP